jgi:hypothetical protein
MARRAVIPQSVGEVIEAGANLMGRGMAAGVETMAAVADRAIEMTGITSPRNAARAADRATRSTQSARKATSGKAKRAKRG